jgi:hypothetical protein
MMSTLDREPRDISANRPSPLFERRVDPGVNTLRPARVDPPSLLAPKPPRGADMTGAPGRMPVKR